MYLTLFDEDPPHISKKVKYTLHNITDQFPIGEVVYIMVSDTYKAPHALLMVVIGRVLLKEVPNQLTTGLCIKFVKGKKGQCPMFPLTIGAYTLENFKEAEAKYEDLNGFIYLFKVSKI